MNKSYLFKCLLCNGDVRVSYRGMSGYVDGTKFDVFECNNCLSSFVESPGDLKEQYNIIYGGDTSKDGSYDYYYYLAKGIKSFKKPLKVLSNYSAIFWGVVKALSDFHIKPKAKILEIGSGLGYLTFAFNREGYECEGLDYSKTATDFANSFFGEYYKQGLIEDFSEKYKDQYDVVVATEVIEHVVDPNKFIFNILKVLRPGGIVILTTPIKDIHPKGTIWETNPAPEHLWWFTEKGIEEIAKNNHAKVNFIDFTDYTKNKIWKINLGKANVNPNRGPVVTSEGKMLKIRKLSYKERIMKILPPYLYIKLVCFYHDLKFLQKDKSTSKYMYGMCAVISKSD